MILESNDAAAEIGAKVRQGAPGLFSFGDDSAYDHVMGMMRSSWTQVSRPSALGAPGPRAPAPGFRAPTLRRRQAHSGGWRPAHGNWVRPLGQAFLPSGRSLVTCRMVVADSLPLPIAKCPRVKQPNMPRARSAGDTGVQKRRATMASWIMRSLG